MSEKDLYAILGVAKTASPEEIKKAYRKLSMKWHPDRNPDNKEAAEAKFKEINKAYEILSDPQKRSTYDRFGFNAATGQAGAGGGASFEDMFGDSGFADIFGSFFGQGARAQDSRNRRGADLSYEMQISLEEAVNGCEKQIRIPKQVVCDKCHGSGAKDGSAKKQCQTCHGSGQVRMQNGFFAIMQPCPTCRGAGELIDNPCDKCHGHGRVKEVKRSPMIKIPAGVNTGDRIRIAGEGEAGERGAPAGDLYIEIDVRKHDIFTRDGDDLYCQMPISFATACLGGELEVPTLTGRVKLSIPAETQTGRTFRLKGKGVKSLRHDYVGDLLCTVSVETPVKLSKEQKELLAQFDQSIQKGGQRHAPKASGFLDRVKNFFDNL